MTGIVFAGFGKKDIFPSTYSFEVYGAYSGELLIGNEVDNCKKIGYDRRSMVLPYAQDGITKMFLTGVDPYHFAGR